MRHLPGVEAVLDHGGHGTGGGLCSLLYPIGGGIFGSGGAGGVARDECRGTPEEFAARLLTEFVAAFFYPLNGEGVS